MTQRVPLRRDASACALEAAIRTQAQIVVECPCLAGVTLNGFLVSGDEQALLVELTGRPSCDLATFVDRNCRVQIYADERYAAESRISGIPTWGTTRGLALERPAVLTVCDRRRSRRARLAPSSQVELEWQAAGKRHVHRATLLNISPEGLACRLEDIAATFIEPGRQIGLRFELPPQGRAFHLHAMITNKTPASVDHSILGMQFLRRPDDAVDLEALRILLNRTQESEHRSEVLV